MNEESTKSPFAGIGSPVLASGGNWRPIMNGGWGRAATRDRLKWNCAEGGELPVWEFRCWSGRVRFDSFPESWGQYCTTLHGQTKISFST